jgi:RNA polymerase sigma-70 factor (ECF subfamily)
MIKSFDDNGLVIGLRNGDQEAFKQIYTLHSRALYYFARRLLRDKEEAEDIVVSIFIKLLNKKNDFEKLADVKSFLYTATRNACFDHLRKVKPINLNEDSEELEIMADEHSLENELIKAKVLQVIYAEVESLPAQCKEVFKALFIDGKSTNQIAQEMGLSTQTVLNHKSRALTKLRTALLKHGLVSVGLIIDNLLHFYFRNKA